MDELDAVPKTWKLSDIAVYLQVSETQAGCIVESAGFPKPVVLPTRGRGERQMKRWGADKVIKWFDSQQIAA